MAEMVWPDAWIAEVIALNGDWTVAEIGPNVILIVEVSGLSGTWIAEEYAEVAKVVFTLGIMPTTGWQEPGIVACGMPGDMRAGKNSVSI
jgi:hypothetical protein